VLREEAANRVLFAGNRFVLLPYNRVALFVPSKVEPRHAG